ncbi:hypothetical protein V6N12_062069 [Hibiscus sabdariffa]|uniref:Beta-glucosidase n=1 Tax=Hibiscus sabdariffa TaxID=183260 RepID=A0ABR2F7X1_9ROSI
MLSISTTPDSLHCLMKNSIIVLIACLCVHGQPTQGPLNEYLNVRRSDFPDDFLFGASTSAAQIEGSTKSGGKGPSAWDQFIREFPDKIMDKSNMEVAADSYNRYKATQGGQIGISHVAQYFEPYSNTSLDEEASKRAIDFELGWFMEPLVRGDYPESMRRLVKDRLPVFTAEEKELVKGSFDFIAISYYSSRYAKDIPTTPNAAPVSYMVDSNVNVTVEKDGVLIGPNAGGSYTEKSNDNIPISQTLKDDIRIDFVQKHLYQTQTAIKNGVNVKGYFYYSLIDSFEWGEGYTVRYGLYHVDFKNLTRSPKESAKWSSRRQGDEQGWRNGYEGHGKMKGKAF